MVHVNQLDRHTVEYLQFFGIPHRRIITGNVNVRILIVPQPVLCGNPSTVLLRVLRQVVLRNIMSTSTVAHSSGMSPISNCRILIIRRDGTRRVTNHDVMFKAIEHQHSDCELVVHTGKEPLKGQLELFRRATSIVGPHGAGLSNIFISRPDTGILEFLTIHGVNLVFMIAAAKLGLQYWALAFPDSSHEGSMTADIPEVLSVVKEMVTYASKGHVPQ
jgi:capsular polysaccharide biosynthesis protein